MAFEGEDGVGVGCVVYFKETYLGIAPRSEELFVGCYFEAVHLTVGTAECAAVDSARCFPESDFVVITRSG